MRPKDYLSSVKETLQSDSSLKSTKKLKVLLIDDDKALLLLLREFFKEKGFDTVTCENAEAALELVLTEKLSLDLIISDLNLPDKSGIDFIQELTAAQITTPVILITGYGTIGDAAMALKHGACDYITKPLNFTELEVLSQRAIKIRNLEENYKKLQECLSARKQTSEMIGSGQKMRDLMVLIHKVAQSVSNILIIGESGSGKEMVAQAIHEKSKRKDRPFVPINCSAIPSDLLEAELFGYKKGSFTGASEDRKGLFEEANGGTLFLDEIGDMPLSLQAKVLRAIQEKTVKPIGENQQREVDVRILAATHRDLKEAISKKEFREDLYFRLCVIPVVVPPLRDRKEDIPLLASFFLKKYSALNEKNVEAFSSEAIAKLKRLRWSGNVRELENTIERAVVLSNDSVLSQEDITLEGGADEEQVSGDAFKELLSLKDLEEKYIKFVLGKTNGKKEEAADILGINRKTLYRKEKEYGI